MLSSRPFCALCFCALFTLAAPLLSPAARADGTFTITGDPADRELLYSAGSGYSGSSVTNTAIFVGASHLTNSNNPHVGIFVFQLPTLAAGAQFATANLNLIVSGISAPSFNANLSGLTRTSASATVLTGTTNDETDAAKSLQSGYVTSSATANSTVVSSDISGFLNTQYSGGANAGQYVFFRVDGGPGGSTVSDNSYSFFSANSTTTRPIITYTISSAGQGAAPEASGLALLLIPIGLLAGAFLRRHLSGSPRTGG